MTELNFVKFINFFRVGILKKIISHTPFVDINRILKIDVVKVKYNKGGAFES